MHWLAPLSLQAGVQELRSQETVWSCEEGQDRRY